MMRDLHSRKETQANLQSGPISSTIKALLRSNPSRRVLHGLVVGAMAFGPLTAFAYDGGDDTDADVNAERKVKKVESISEVQGAAGGVVKAATPTVQAAKPVKTPSHGVYSSLSDAIQPSDVQPGTVVVASKPTEQSSTQPTSAGSIAEVTRLPAVDMESSESAIRERLIDPSRFKKQTQAATQISAAPPTTPVLERLPEVSQSSFTTDVEEAVPDARLSSRGFGSSARLSDNGGLGGQLSASIHDVIAPHRYLTRDQQEVAILADQAQVRSAELVPVGKPISVSDASNVRVANNVAKASLKQEEEDENWGTVELMPLAARPLDGVRPSLGDERPEDKAVTRFGVYDANSEFSYGMVRSKLVDGAEYAWNPSLATWEAPAFYHRPLYFEEINVERYGHHKPMVQPFISGATFFATLPIVPYKMGVHKPCEPIFTLGHHRPGSCNPHQIHYLPFSWRGVAYQSAATVGLIYGVPTYQ